MRRARIVLLKRRETFQEKMRRVAGSKLTVFSILVLLAGVILIQLSYNYTDVIVTPNVRAIPATVGQNSTVSLKFNQDYNLSETVEFTMGSGNQVNYTLYKYNVYTSYKGTVVHQFLFLRNGSATNNTLIQLSRMYLPQGQTYYLNMTSAAGNTFAVNVKTVENVTVVEHSARYLGAPGLGVVMVASVMLAYAITRELDLDSIKSMRF